MLGILLWVQTTAGLYIDNSGMQGEMEVTSPLSRRDKEIHNHEH
ncbi:MAG: hypothetical protein ACR2N1_09525 [Rubripirellula sp.]